MGDKNRNIIFDKFIRRNFPRAERLLCVADGKAELANLLSVDKNVTVIDPRPRGLYKNVNYIKSYFGRDFSLENYDVVVGMHPDEATTEIIEAANKFSKPFAIVPCCVKGRAQYINGIKGFWNWLDLLDRLTGPNGQKTILPFRGKNTVIYRK